MKKYIYIFALLGMNLQAQITWESMHGPPGGEIACLSSGYGKIFAGTANNGVYVSYDQGEHWQEANLNSGMNSYDVLVKDSLSIFAIVNYTLYRSTNGGTAWAVVRDSMPLCVSVDNDNNLLAGTELNGIFKSTDNGDTWHQIGSDLIGGVVQKIVQSPKGHLYAGLSNGLYRSTDGGNNWYACQQGLGGNLDIGDILPLNDSLLFAGTHGGNVYKTTNGGEQWFASGTGILSPFIIDMEIDRQGRLMAATYDYVYRSTDEGLNWFYCGTGFGDPFATAIEIIDEKTMLTGTSASLYRSTDSGEHWDIACQGISLTYIKSIIFLHDGRMMVSALGNGIFIYDQGNDVWLPSNNGITSYQNGRLDIDKNGYIYLAAYNGVFKSTNNGLNWEFKNNGISSNDYAFYPICVNLNDHIFLGGFGYRALYRSTDQGENWEKIGYGTGWTFVKEIINIDTGFIIASGDNYPNNQGVFYSTNDGDSWIQTNFNNTARSLAINSYETIFAGDVGIYRSSDLGLNWLYLGLPNIGVNDIIILRDSLIIVGGSGYGGNPPETVWISTNYGTNWTPYTQGLPTTHENIRTVTADSNNYLYLGTQSKGVFRSQQRIIGIEEPIHTVREFSLYQNYPNPFNPSTTIRYLLPANGKVSLKIYNTLGQEVRSLVNGNQTAGTYSILWDGKNHHGTAVTSGVYFYRLETDQYVKTMKMVLVR